MISTLLIIPLYFSAILLSLPNVSSQRISLVTAVVRCGHGTDDMLEDGTPKKPLELATSFRSQSKLDLKQYSKCRKKLQITMRISESKKDFVPHGLVMIDRGENLLTHKSSRFGFPIAVKFYQQPLYQKFGLQFLYRVNGKMYEEVMNINNTNNYMGCSNNAIGTTQPICGYISGSGSRQPAGFCCHCNYPNHKKNVSRRGGHRCDTPGKTRAELTSAHCLRSSPYWYNVYELSPPSLFQRLNFDIFRSQEEKNGSLKWTRMSGRANGIEIDSENSMNAAGSVKVKYRPHVEGIRKSSMLIDPSSHRFLIPLPNPFVGHTTDPEPLQGALEDQILIIPKSLMSPNGQVCDRVGTKIDAFLNQSARCQQSQNTCLGNQPFDLWKQDQGDPKTKFRLKSYLNKQSPLIDIAEDFKNGSLFMPHRPEAPSYVDIEIPGDDILILAPGYNAFVESVLTDTGMEGAKIITQVVNKEVVEAAFSVELVHCSLDISQKGASMKSNQKLIGPLNTHIFHLDVHTDSIKKALQCYVVLVNEFNEYVAAREVILMPKETCLCVHTCKCACGDNTNLKCERLSDENIIATGLITAIKTPEQVEAEEKSHFTQKYKWVFHWILVFHIILLIFACFGWIQKKCSKNRKKERGVAGQGSKSKQKLIDDKLDDEGSSSDEGSEASEVTLFSKKGTTNSKLLEKNLNSELVGSSSMTVCLSKNSSTMPENVLTQRSLTRVASSTRRNSTGSGGRVTFEDYPAENELSIVEISASAENKDMNGSPSEVKTLTNASSGYLDTQKMSTMSSAVQQSVHTGRVPSETSVINDPSIQRSNNSIGGPLEQKSVTDNGTVTFTRTRSKLNQSATAPENMTSERSINQSHFNSQTDAGSVISGQSLHQSRVNPTSHLIESQTRSNLDFSSAQTGPLQQRSQYAPSVNQNQSMARTANNDQISQLQPSVNQSMARTTNNDQRSQLQSNVNPSMTRTANNDQRSQLQPNVNQSMAGSGAPEQRTHWSQYQSNADQRMAGPGGGGPRSQNHLDVNPSVTRTDAMTGVRSTNVNPSLTQAVTSQMAMQNQPKPNKSHKSQGPQAMDSSDLCIDSDPNNNPVDVDSFLNYCVSASSSRTSFGTWHRKKRDQYSAYDFLPEAKQRGSNT